MNQGFGSHQGNHSWMVFWVSNSISHSLHLSHQQAKGNTGCQLANCGQRKFHQPSRYTGFTKPMGIRASNFTQLKVVPCSEECLPRIEASLLAGRVGHFWMGSIREILNQGARTGARNLTPTFCVFSNGRRLCEGIPW